MKEFLIDFIKNGLTSLDGNIANVLSILSENFWGRGNVWYDLAKAISLIIQPVALSIISICFIIEFLKIIMDANILKWQFGLKIICKFILAKVCMDGAFYVLGLIYTTAAEWISSIGSETPDIGNSAWTVISTEISNYGLMEMLGLSMSLGIVFVAIWVISLIVQVIAYARKFELVVYLAVAPLPCAFLPLEDGSASRITWKYIMSFASVCLQGVFIIISVKLYGVLCVEELSQTIIAGENIGKIAGQLLISSLVLVMAIIKSSSWARNIFDAA